MKYLFTLLLTSLFSVAYSQEILPPRTADMQYPHHEISGYSGGVTDFDVNLLIFGGRYRYAVTKEFGLGLNCLYATNSNASKLITGLQADFRVEASPSFYYTPGISINIADGGNSRFGAGVHFDMMYKPAKFLGIFLEPSAMYFPTDVIIVPVKLGLRFMF